jgi:mannose-1-phosphate guanylyltransferase
MAPSPTSVQNQPSENPADHLADHPAGQPFIPVILAGGSGERFWPLSRRAKPKQFLQLDGTGRSLIQATADRLAPLSDGVENIYIVTGQQHRGLILEHLPDLPLQNLVVEPMARDTAPAVLLAALRVRDHHGPETIMGVFHSDHRIGNLTSFHLAVAAAIEAVKLEGGLVTLGMTATYPATGYGYIEKGEHKRQVGGFTLNQVSRFVEKPNAETAEAFLATGRYSWNAGMFVFRASTILEEYAKHAPELLAELEAVHNGTRAALTAAFERIPKISVDVAIMERSDQVLVIPAEFEWDDLGDWNAVARLLQGANPNVEVGQHLGLDTSGAILYTTGDDLFITIGLEDVVIVRDGNVVLVARKDRTQDIKKLVERMKQSPELEKYV